MSLVLISLDDVLVCVGGFGLHLSMFKQLRSKTAEAHPYSRVHTSWIFAQSIMDKMINPELGGYPQGMPSPT